MVGSLIQVKPPAAAKNHLNTLTNAPGEGKSYYLMYKHISFPQISMVCDEQKEIYTAVINPTK